MPGGLGRLRECRLEQLQLLGLDGRPGAATFVAVVVFLLVVVVAAIWRKNRLLVDLPTQLVRFQPRTYSPLLVE